jgi:hypothetical protein
MSITKNFFSYEYWQGKEGFLMTKQLDPIQVSIDICAAKTHFAGFIISTHNLKKPALSYIGFFDEPVQIDYLHLILHITAPVFCIVGID